MPKTLEFLFDFGAPNGYLAWKVLPALIERTGAELVLTPILIGGVFKATNNRPPIMAYAEVPAKWAYEQLELQRFITLHGLDRFRLNPHFPVNSLTLMRMAMVVQADGDLPHFIDAAYAAMWEDGHNMGDPAVIAEVIDAKGFDVQPYPVDFKVSEYKVTPMDFIPNSVALGNTEKCIREMIGRTFYWFKKLL
jgi:2-hydroxychromene-2-carboxylate isomerase